MDSCVDSCTLITGFPLEKVVVFDTETTGTSAYSGDEILSIGICDGMGNPLFNSLVKPSRHTKWPDAERVNGISPDMVKDAPTLKEIAPQIREHLLGNKLVVGYNVVFDISFLVEGNAIDGWPASTFDVMTEYATVHGSKPSRYGIGYAYSKLSVCAESYGYAFGAHDAMADARATAHCFRALMCDERYIRPKIKSIMENLKRLSVSQTKATTETVLDLVDNGVTSSVKAELRLGEITRGKNKGAPRYECFVDDRCVGVSSASSVDQIRKLYALEESDKLPNRVPCKALLQAAGSSAHCSVTITARGKLLDSVVSSAAIIRDECEMNYRKPAAPELNTNSQAPGYCSYPGAQQGTTVSVPPAIPSPNGSASYGVGYDQSTRQSNIPVNVGEMPGCAKSAGRLVVVIIVLIFLIGMISRSCSSI